MSVTKSSPSSPSTEAIRDNIRSIVSRECRFSDVWPFLIDLGWKNLNTDSLSWHIGSSVYVPSWEVERLEESSLTKYPAKEKVRKRDFFCDGDEVISYIKKYGLVETQQSVTPVPQMKRSQKPLQPSHEITRASAESSTSTAKKSSSSVANMRRDKPVNDQRSSSMLANGKYEVSPDLPVETNIKRILMWDPAQRYQFKPLWDNLKLYGWKSVWTTNDQYYVPHWVTSLPADTSKRIKIEDLSGLILNVDYFDNKDAVIDYLKKYGLKRVANAEATENSYRARKHQSKPQAEPQLRDLVLKKKPSSKESKKRSIAEVDTGISVFPQKRKIEDPELRRILNIDQSKRYLFPELWAYLAHNGWKYAQTNDPLIDMVYVASWAITSTPIKGYRFNPSSRTLNVDYFIDTKDVVEYVTKNGLRRISTVAYSSHEAEGEVEGNLMADEDVDPSSMDESSENCQTTDSYSIRLINPKRPIRGRECSDPYSAAFELIESAASPSSNSDDHVMIESYTSESSPESSADKLKSWIGLPRLEVVTHALDFLDNGKHSNCLIGRSQEYRDLLSAIESSRESGIGCNILLHGQPGQGKSHMVKSVIAYYQKMKEFSSVPIDIVFVQGTAAMSSNDVFASIRDSLALDRNTLSAKDAVLQRFRTDAITRNSDQNEVTRSSKKHRPAKKVPLTLLVIEEAYQANLNDIRTIMELGEEGPSSVVVIGVFNNRAMYDSLRMNEESFSKMDVEVYSVESLEQIADHYLSGIADSTAVRLLAMNCLRNDNCKLCSLSSP
jgi:hypothetical protein